MALTQERFTREKFNSLIADKKNYKITAVNDRVKTILEIKKNGHIDFDFVITENESEYVVSYKMSKDKHALQYKLITESVFNILWRNSYGWAVIREM